jgi:protein TonB
MNTKVENVPMDEIPLPCPYGAAELKAFIRRYTFRGLGVAVALLLLFLITFYIFQKIEEQKAKAPKVAPMVKLNLENLPPPSNDAQMDAPPPPSQQILNTGPAARAGTPVPVPDAQISPDLKDFATVKEIARASAAGGSGVDMGGFAANIDFDATKTPVKVEVKEKEPEPDEFIAVEKEPGVDLAKLQSLVTYPELARRAGVEGTVIVRVLVTKDGSVSRMLIEYSDNKLLDQAAEEAIRKYGRFTPAIQNGQPIACWVSIPIRFKLR